MYLSHEIKITSNKTGVKSMANLLHRFHSANNSENLVDYLLNSLGLANPPRRQYDHGYDFYCLLSEPVINNENLLKFDYPFTIQVKSGKTDKVIYGSAVSKKWHKEQIEWLFSHQTPFFIGFFDTQKHTLKIYDTSGIWYLYAKNMMNFAQIIFRQGKTETDNLLSSIKLGSTGYPTVAMRDLPKALPIPKWKGKPPEGIKYVIDMGNPIATISIEDTKDPVTLAIIRRALRAAIILETNNIRNRNLGLKYFQEVKNNIPNDPRFLLGASFDSHDKQYSQNLIEAIRPALISLYINTNTPELEGLRSPLKDLLKNLPPNAYFDQWRTENQGVFD